MVCQTFLATRESVWLLMTIHDLHKKKCRYSVAIRLFFSPKKLGLYCMKDFNLQILYLFPTSSFFLKKNWVYTIYKILFHIPYTFTYFF
jgi:hypothetical protein